MMNKRVRAEIYKFKKDNPKIRFCLGTVALIAMCVMFLIISTFTQIKFDMNIPEIGMQSDFKFEYIPQIPVVLYIAALLGEMWALVAVLVYIIMGLTPCMPVFALGGGLSYFFQYSFGYILAYIPAVLFVSRELNNGKAFWHKITATLYGIAVIHVLGILYMIVVSMLRQDAFDAITNMIYYQSMNKIIYDIIIGFFAVLFARGCRKLLWIIMG